MRDNPALKALLAGGRTALSTVGKAMLWVIPIVVLGFGVYYLVGGSPPDERLTKPDSFVAAYNSFAQPMSGNRGELPSIGEVDRFLSFFDDHSRTWFERNAWRMSLPLNVDRKAQWHAFSEDMKKMEALRYLLARGVFAGTGHVTHAKSNDRTHEAQVVLNVKGRDIPLTLSFDGRRYYFTRLMGQMEALDKELPTTAPPIERTP